MLTAGQQARVSYPELGKPGMAQPQSFRDYISHTYLTSRHTIIQTT
jgi:hypothetical protein